MTAEATDWETEARRHLRRARLRFYAPPWAFCVVGCGVLWIAPAGNWIARALTITVLFIVLGVEETLVRDNYYRRGWNEGLAVNNLEGNAPPVWVVDGAFRRARRMARRMNLEREDGK